ncbi:hypothetical protein ACFY0A_44550 [Streptomyces sp. NPDC001698]|uniref:hypothetical protein n=1 Tax=Streptomyces sp. NPDC001698 TaxID=3364601 RepID=UPI0036BF56CA
MRIDRHSRIAHPMHRHGQQIEDPSGRITGEGIGDAVTRAAARADPSLWARDGSLFEVIGPQSADGGPEVSAMRVAPVVDGQVVLSTAGCWMDDVRPIRPYPGPLAEIPGSHSYRRAAEVGFQTVPLSEVERLASH